MMRQLLDLLDDLAKKSTPARVWWRDDDATNPSAPLDRLLDLTEAAGIPLTLAVIPAFSGAALARSLRLLPHVTVAVHGWAHQNHANSGEKKQELGPHRPASAVLEELSRGLGHLTDLHGAQAAPVLVPPWNRISADVVALLPEAGFAALSVFGPEQPGPLPIVNTHVDVMDWRGTRGGRAADAVMADLIAAIQRGRPVGIVTHHLVHDAAAWNVLETLARLTKGHPGWHWVGLPELAAAHTRPQH
ncbi:MAG: polysaccharide deacetylase family protein [Pseudorhodobacter sp.]